jgi:flagellar protein FliO/FliZ
MTRSSLQQRLSRSGFTFIAFVILAASSAVTRAAESSAAATTSPTSSAGSLFQALLGLVVVLGLLAAAAWSVRRMGVGKRMSASNVKIVGGVSVGNRERVLVVEVADQWIVVGVAPGSVNALTTMPKREAPAATTPSAADAGPQNFAAWLKQTIDKRNAR